MKRATRKSAPVKKILSDKIIDLKIEHLRLIRERAILVLNKGIIIYFAFLIGAIIGRTNQVITLELFNMLVVLGVVILIVAIIPYAKTMAREEDEIARLMEQLESQ
ncbi:hypothetical protein AUJ68_02040 [Candidatus Woesearchaeota archaeon CG1_02_57_44]|nr:MAG: hypothetical protein AUJ68_02040 [Candidatus Woesearchaeota archaeon CG1_02_57_44]PIN68684.1 MAG: hypothetical protein COV94_03820 [Candidatus Woesearchaeota archaeon CG11_big_fil_rev_8_21_14_0_20_57_5]